MKKALLLVMGFAVYGLQAQVGINTTDPQSTLDVNGDVRIQNSLSTDIPSHSDCPCFLVVDRDGKVKRVPITQGSGSGSGGTSGGGTVIIGGVSPVDGGVANQSVLTPDNVVEIGWNTYQSNFNTVTLSVNLPANVPYSAYMSPTVDLPTVDGGVRKVSIMYPKGTTNNNRKITATLLFDGDHTYAPKLRFTEGETESFEVPLYFNGVEQTAKLTLHAGINAVKNTEHGKTFTYPVVKIGDKYMTAMNLGAEYAKEATAKPAVLKTWREKSDWQKDFKAYGSLFQWGRPADGHELIDWKAHNQGEARIKSGVQWKKNNQLSLTGRQWVCPTGWHVPDKDEWIAIYKAIGGGPNTNNKVFYNDAVARFVLAGNRTSTASFSSQGDVGYYWSSSEYPSESAYNMFFTYDYSIPSDISYHARGFAVRCLKD